MDMIARDFAFVGNALWIDFANTLWLERSRIVDRLSDATDLVWWASASDAISDDLAARMLAELANKALSYQLLDEAKALRGELRRSLDALIAGHPLPETSEAMINRFLQQQPICLRLDRAGSDYRVHWQCADQSARAILGLVARDVAQFLAQAELDQLRRCSNPSCPAYFYDTSKNRGRRWCSMDLCGNRLKVAKHRAKVLGGGLRVEVYAPA